MSIKVCFECGTMTRHYTRPYQQHPCTNKEHDKYNYSNENQFKIPDKIEWVQPVNQDGQQIDVEEMAGEPV